jgi:hypothetical protein
MDDAADDAPVVHPRNAAHVGRQMRLDPSPLRFAQPEQMPAHRVLLQIRINAVSWASRN